MSAIFPSLPPDADLEFERALGGGKQEKRLTPSPAQTQKILSLCWCYHHHQHRDKISAVWAILLLFLVSLAHTQSYVSPTAGPTYAEISGPSVVRLLSGSALSLECQVSGLMLPPKHLYWTHNKLVLTPKNRPGLSLESEKLSGFSISKLILVDVGLEDEGIYACVTDVTPPKEVKLIIGKIVR